jgi:hypothetical protein
MSSISPGSYLYAQAKAKNTTMPLEPNIVETMIMG